MRNIIWVFLAASTFLSTSSFALEINLIDSNGNVLEDICGSKRNPDLKSINTYIPYTQEECDRKAEFKRKKQIREQWYEQVSKPLGRDINKQLKLSEEGFSKWVRSNKSALQKEYGMYWNSVHLLYYKYKMNLNHVRQYYVHYNAGNDGVQKFITWFNESGGFDLDEWKKQCGNDPAKFSDCKNELIKDSEKVKIESVDFFNKTQYRDQFIYFHNNKL